jgi:hypothetical protein
VEVFHCIFGTNTGENIIRIFFEGMLVLFIGAVVVLVSTGERYRQRSMRNEKTQASEIIVRV